MVAYIRHFVEERRKEENIEIDHRFYLVRRPLFTLVLYGLAPSVDLDAGVL